MNDNTLLLISNLIERTKSGELSWNHYQNSSFDLKPIYSSPLEGSVMELAVDTINKPILIPEDSFVCSYNNGYLFFTSLSVSRHKYTYCSSGTNRNLKKLKDLCII